MLGRISQSRRFIVEWVILNIAGFVVGSLLGATDYSLVDSLLDDSLGARMVGDVIFGGSIGLAQYVVLRRHFPESRPRLRWWIAASAVGFTLGARLGARFAPMLATQEFVLSIVFGIILGGCVGAAEWVAMQALGTLKAERPIVWIPTCVVAWIGAEIIEFGFDFNQLAMPLIALCIALVTGVSLVVWVRPR